MKSWIGTSLLLTILASASVPAVQSDDNRLYRVLPRDAIRAIDTPEFEPAEQADRVMANEELVIGLVGEREQRAYSTWQLDRYEIVNDVFEGRPIAVTWCPLCGTGVVYDRTVGSRTLTFGVSGLLFRDALVMFDRETDTLWTHVDGHAIKGPLGGQTLVPVAAVHATWKQWKTMYPDSQVLKKPSGFRSPYESYNRSSSRLGIFGRRNRDTRLPGKERILGIRADALGQSSKTCRTGGPSFGRESVSRPTRTRGPWHPSNQRARGDLASVIRDSAPLRFTLPRSKSSSSGNILANQTRTLDVLPLA